MPTKAHIHRIRSAAGRLGGIARWADVPRLESTTQIRVYKSDAERIRAMPGSPAECVHALLTGAPQK